MDIRNLQYGTEAYRSITDQVSTRRTDVENLPSGDTTETNQSQQTTSSKDEYVISPEARRLQEAMNSLEKQRTTATANDSSRNKSANKSATYDPKSIASGALRTDATESEEQITASQTQQVETNTFYELGKNIDFKG